MKTALCVFFLSLSALGQTASFTAPKNYYAGDGPSVITVGDLNGDHKPDLIIFDLNGTANGSPLLTLLGNGDGTFQKPWISPFLFGGDALDIGVEIGDFNQDGHLDLVAGYDWAYGEREGGIIGVLLGNGDGTFQAPVLIAGGGRPLAVGDYNGDGKLDIASVDGIATLDSSGQYLGHLYIYLGNGDGTFQAPIAYATVTTEGAGLGFLAAGDFNSDGKLDLALTNYPLGTVSVYLGNGDGTFQPPVDYPTCSYPMHVVARDFAGQGKLDLAMTCAFSWGGLSALVTLLGNGDGTFKAPITNPLGLPIPNYDSNLGFGGAYPIIPGDFNHDGKIDLAMPTASYLTYAGSAAVFLGNGDGTFAPATLYTTGLNTDFLGKGDFNGDGKTDLAAVNYNTRNVSILLNSTGQKTPQVTLRSSLNPSSYNQAVTFSANVKPAPLDWPGEIVTFKNGSTVLGRVKLAKGVASYTVHSLARGSHQITATYSGDCCDYLPASASISQVVK
jgi:large repetitive protein